MIEVTHKRTTKHTRNQIRTETTHSAQQHTDAQK